MNNIAAVINNDQEQIFESKKDPLHKIMEECFYEFLLK